MACQKKFPFLFLGPQSDKQSIIIPYVAPKQIRAIYSPRIYNNFVWRAIQNQLTTYRSDPKSIKPKRIERNRSVQSSALFSTEGLERTRASLIYSSSPTSNIVGKVQHFAGFPTLRNAGLLEPTRNRAGKVNNKSGWGN